MRGLSNRQKAAIEKITGRPHTEWSPEALRAYFNFTDRGIWPSEELRQAYEQGWLPDNFLETYAEFIELYHYHRFHAWTVKQWKEDFQFGLLKLTDFAGEPPVRQEHAREVYEEAMR